MKQIIGYRVTWKGYEKGHRPYYMTPGPQSVSTYNKKDAKLFTTIEEARKAQHEPNAYGRIVVKVTRNVPVPIENIEEKLKGMDPEMKQFVYDELCKSLNIRPCNLLHGLRDHLKQSSLKIYDNSGTA